MNILIFFIFDSYYSYDKETHGFYKYILRQY